MSRAIHKRFVDISSRISSRLEDAIVANGPVKLTRRDTTPLSERLCRIVTGQQLSTKAASTIWSRVIESVGEKDFARHIEAEDVNSLRSCGLSESKAKSMKAIVAADSEGLLNVETLRALSHEERSQQLLCIRGIGQWTCDMISMFYFGDEDVWPDTDVTVWKTLERLTSKRRKSARTANLFAPHRTYLAMYMYQIADATP